MPIKFILSDYKCGKIRGTPQNLLSAGIKLNIFTIHIWETPVKVGQSGFSAIT